MKKVIYSYLKNGRPSVNIDIAVAILLLILSLANTIIVVLK